MPRASRREARSTDGGPAEQPLRTHNEHDDHEGVDDESADLRNIIFPRHVTDAENERGGKRPAQGSRAADRDDDQEIDHELDREGGVEVEDLDAERARETGKSGP